MNKGIFRLVFDARRAMQVPAPERSRGRGKLKARGRSRRLAVAAATLLALSAHAARPLPSSTMLAPRFNLPQAAGNFNQLGRATQAIDAANARRLLIEQTDKRVILNWSSFDIGAGYTVRFNQPTGGSALNRIGGSDPSVILGNLEANAEVILYNANGVLFGKGATVNTGNFIATTLNIADDQFEKGFRNITRYVPAFQAADGEIEGFIRVEAGASIAAANGGDILMFAPRVLNEGRLSAPGGQVALAAGQKVYLAASLDPSARGLLVEVDPFVTADKEYNTVENAARGSTAVTLDSGELVQRLNEIVTERGSINLVGLSVKQMGTARATTAVKGQNGAIYLLAHGKTVSASHSDGISGHTMAKAVELGELVVGPQSVTRVDPDASGATQFDAEPFYNSIVRLEGKQIHLQGGAQISAPGAGSMTPASDAVYQEAKRGVSILASATPLSSGVFGTSAGASDDSRIVIDPGVLIDVSGTSVDLPMSSNILTGRLFSIQLADSPLQRAGVLYRKEIAFDRRTGVKVANAGDFYSQIQRTAAEKLAGGGSIAIKSDGAVVVGQGSKLNVSGGQLDFAGGELKTTQLRQGKRLIDIADARADVTYDEVITPTTGRHEAAYVEGKNAGEIIVAGRQVVLDGALAGNVTAGRYQRGDTSGAHPAAGRLQVGIVAGPSGTPDYYVRNLVLSQTGAAPLAKTFFNDPFNAGLGTRGDTTALSADGLQAGGFGRVELRASELFRIQSGTTLNLGAGGSFAATAGRIEMNGSVTAPAGAIALNAAQTIITGVTPAPGVASVVFSAGASLSTAGYWTTDGRSTWGPLDAAVATGGGSIKVTAYDSVQLPAGAALDVSAGAWRNAAGKLSYGKAGYIDLAANAGNSDPLLQAGTVLLDGAVSGYGFAGGGFTSDPNDSKKYLGLTLSTLDLTVSDVATIKPAFFSDNGFKDISLSSIRDLTIADDTTINARLRYRVLDANPPARASGVPIAAVSHFASDVEVDDVARKAVDLRFAATRQPSVLTGTDGADLVVGKGATVATEASGTLAFRAGQNLTLAGTLAAPGGTISLTVEGARGAGSADNADKIGFRPTQALWLTNTAKILAGGTVEYANGRNGLRSGEVFGGGTVKLAAKHGYLIAEAGSEIDIGGFDATLGLYGGSASSLVSRDAGTLSLSSAEGVLVDSTVTAAAPSPRASGGTLEVSISRQGLDNFTEGTAYSTAERKLVIRQGGASLPALPTHDADSLNPTARLRPMVDLDATLGNGVAAVSTHSIDSAGFATVKLRADDRIEFSQSIDLTAARSVELNSRVISGLGTSAATLAAPYVGLGDIDIVPITSMTAPTASAGTASLAVTAGLIDVVATLGLQGFATSSLSATRGNRSNGEIRLRGRALPGTTAQAGSLLFAGQIDLSAGQIYPTTFSQFNITGLTGNSTLRTHAPNDGSTSALPLSAFGDLKLSADSIEHGGVIRAPFGKLELNAVNSLTLSAGSEALVSGAGITVPVGDTVNGTTWYYHPLGTASAELRTIADLPVAKQVLLKTGATGTLDISPLARVSAAGGGDVQAAQFIPGAGGSKDYLATSKGLYAVLPGYEFDYAPYDAQIQGGTDLKPGEKIVITMAGSGLAPGSYTLLPAAYALLSPNAVLVSKASDQGKGVLNSALSLTDGSTVVTAYRSAAGTATTGDDYQRYLIEPTTTFRAKSAYALTGGSDLFAARAERQGITLGSLPKDAGRISIAAHQLASWQALFDLSAPTGARAGEFDLAVPNIVLVGNGQAPSSGHAAAEGYTTVSTDSLTATGAGSILLGGTRSGAGASVTVDTVSDHVHVESSVQANELHLAARKSLDVAADTVIAATGTAETVPGQLNLSGDGAFLRVSNREGVDIVRTGVLRAFGFGDLTLGARTKLAGAQVDIDATGATTLDSSTVLAANSFGLGAGRISFGGISPEGGSVVIDGSLLTTLRGSSSLSIRSYTTIDFLDSLDLALTGKGRLLLDAPGLRGLGDASATVRLSASEVLLRNSSGNTLSASGQGALNIEAHPPLRDGKTGGMEIGAGSQSLGFDRVTLSSKDDLAFSGTGQVKTQGAIDLVARRVTGATGADHGVVAGGVLTVSRPADGHTLGERVGLGVKLALSGERVVQNGSIDLPGGQLTVTAANTAGMPYGIEFGTGSVTRAGGFSVTTADGWTSYGDAGSIKLSAAKGAVKVDGVLGVAAAAGGGNAGSLSISAAGALGSLELGTAAVLEGTEGNGGEGGTFAADLLALPGNMDGLAQSATGFTHKFDLRVRTGNVALVSQQLKAETVSIAADAGSLTVTSTIDARAAQGGLVQLAAGNNMTLGSGGRILANSSRTGANGGDVLLAAKTGMVTVATGSTIDAGGDDSKDGRVVLRATRGTSTVNVAPIAGAISAGEIAIEAVKTYAGTSLKTGTTSGLAIGQSTLTTDMTNFMANKSTILSGLGVSADLRFHLRPGVELASTGDFTVTNDWNLYSASRPGGEPGFLTIRAAGNLNVNGTLSDGFNGLLRTAALQSGDAWSLRLAAGAHLAAANPLAINGAGTGDLSIAGGKLLRTSSGSIELGAGRDIVLGGTTAAPATVMVTGSPSELDPVLANNFMTPTNAVFTSRGGRIAASAGRDIKSPASDQLLIDNWFFRSGRLDPDSGQYFDNLAWWSRLDLFRHGFGSFGGGRILLSAGRDVQDVSAVAPTTARMASITPDLSKLVVENGGDLEVTAGRNIAGGAYFVGRGDAILRAGGIITKGNSPASNIGQLAPLLAVMDGSLSLRALGDISITAAFNPTIFSARRGTSFYTYEADTSLDVASIAGSISWPSISANVFTNLAKLPAASAEKMTLVDVDNSTLNVVPPNVSLMSFAGGINFSANSSNAVGISLFPSPNGNLTMFSGSDTLINTSIRIMDNAPASLPSITSFSTGTAAAVFLGMVGSTVSYDINKLIFTDLHAGDEDPVRISAEGSITVTDGKKLLLPKQASIAAGLDITNLTLYGQHHQENDATLIAAGRNLVNNTILGTRGLISLAGPGTLELEAGRQLSLGGSAGVETTGSLYNTTLPAQGASVKISAGLDAKLDANGLASFVSKYLAASGAASGANYRSRLIQFVKQTLNRESGAGYSYDQALARFNDFSDAGRIGFVKSVLAEEFGRSYLAPGKPYAAAWTQAATDAGVSPDVFGGKTFERLRDKIMFEEIQLGGIAGSSAKDAAAKDAGYAQGYTAIDLAGYGAPFRFVGDIDLIQSKVQTKSGGDIEFRAPGGGVNVGLSADVSSAIGGTKPSDQRGVVAYAGGNIRSFSGGDFLVNAQKVFVIGAGDILLWSSNGNIDSGKGSNSTVTVPPLVPKIDPTDGSIIFELPTLATGSGIGILDASNGKADGAAYLFAPRGEVIALDAFIRAPTIFFDPDKIRGADNVIGAAANPVSAPATVSVGGLGTVASNPTDATSAGNAAPKAGDPEKNSILTVEVLALGDGEPAGGNKAPDEKRKKDPEDSQ